MSDSNSGLGLLAAIVGGAILSLAVLGILSAYSESNGMGKLLVRKDRILIERIEYYEKGTKCHGIELSKTEVFEPEAFTNYRGSQFANANRRLTA